jgi:hypothetical protein
LCHVRVADIGPLLVLKLNAFGGPSDRRLPKDALRCSLSRNSIRRRTDSGDKRFPGRGSRGKPRVSNRDRGFGKDFLQPEDDGSIRAAEFLGSESDMPTEELPSQGGGAATAGGMSFQDRVAAWLAVRILAETNVSPLWDFPSSSTVDFIRCETEQPVDDIMVGISHGGLAFLQVKRSISLDRVGESPFAKTISQFVRQALRPPVHGNKLARPWDKFWIFAAIAWYWWSGQPRQEPLLQPLPPY